MNRKQRRKLKHGVIVDLSIDDIVTEDVTVYQTPHENECERQGERDPIFINDPFESQITDPFKSQICIGSLEPEEPFTIGKGRPCIQDCNLCDLAEWHWFWRKPGPSSICKNVSGAKEFLIKSRTR